MIPEYPCHHFVAESDRWLSELAFYLATHTGNLLSTETSTLPESTRNHLYYSSGNLSLDGLTEVAEACLLILEAQYGVSPRQHIYTINDMVNVATALMMGTGLGQTLSQYRISLAKSLPQT